MTYVVGSRSTISLLETCYGVKSLTEKKKMPRNSHYLLSLMFSPNFLSNTFETVTT